MARGRGIGFKLNGARDLGRALQQLPERLAKNTIDRALIRVGGPIADDAARIARANASGSTGKNASKVMVSKKLSRRQRREAGRPDTRTRRTVYIGVRPSPVAHLIEWGTVDRWTTGVGDGRRREGHQEALKRLGFQPAFRGRMEAEPFMRPAWDRGKDKALDDLGRILGEEIEKTARRLARRQAKRR